MTDITPENLLDYQPADGLLAGRIILVTGAAEGIGRALSLECGRLGATVILLDRYVKRLEKLYDEIEKAGGPQPAIYPMNLEGATVKDYEDLADNIEKEFGRLDGLVNNAGWVAALTPFRLYDPEVWARVMTVNLHAPFLITRACLPLLERAENPSVVFSTHACRRAYWGAFGIAKAGIEGMLDILAAEYDGTDRPIRVNGVDTGPVRTAMRVAIYPGEDPNAIPKPEDRIAPYLYLLGPDSRGVTGRNIKIEGAGLLQRQNL